MSGYDLSSGMDATFFHDHSDNQKKLFGVIELFPIPMEVFSSDGVSLFVNKAFKELFHISDSKEIVGSLNVLIDPYINQKLGLADYLQRVFAGEILSFNDIRVPMEDICAHYIPNQHRTAENDIYQEITCFPIWSMNRTVEYVVALFMTKRTYQLRLDAIKAKEYIDVHWLDEFDMNRIAEATSFSRYHLARLFKRYIGMAPYSYYQEIKIQKIKDALCDTSLSIRDAFASCGADYNGRFAEVFKNKVGMTPSQYRKTLMTNICLNWQDTTALSKEARKQNRFPIYPIHTAYVTEEHLFKIADLFPIPIQIFKPNGDIVFINEAVLKMWNVLDTTEILGKYNLISDPFVNEQFGLRDHIRRTFRGEIVLIPDIRIPLENFWEWYKKRSNVYDIESIYTDILNFPVLNEGGLITHIISIFLTSRIYKGNSDVARTKEYLENHWRDEFDIGKIADAVHLSPSHLARLFKKHTGKTPFGYYQELKLNRLKEALRDKNLSVSEAYRSCGIEYHGNLAKNFKERVGMSPSLYKRTIGK